MFGRFFTTRPCVGCGFCCAKALCPPARAIFPHLDRCPFLKWEDTRYICLLARDSEEHALMLGIGDGCIRPFNRWRRDVRRRV